MQYIRLGSQPSLAQHTFVSSIMSLTHYLRYAHIYMQTNVNGVIGIVSCCRLGMNPSGLRFSVPSTVALRLSQCTVQSTETFLRLKWLKRGDDHPPPLSARLQMGWRYTSAPLSPLCLDRYEMG